MPKGGVSCAFAALCIQIGRWIEIYYGNNLAVLLQKAVAVQLLPFGWEIQDGEHKGRTVRENLYKGMVVGLNATYFRWVNHDPADAFFRRCVHCNPSASFSMSEWDANFASKCVPAIFSCYRVPLSNKRLLIFKTRHD